jgi:hypothetical protein
MELTKASQSHGLELASVESTELIVIIRLATFNKAIIASFFSIGFPERTTTELPYVIPVQNLKFLHEKPVLVSVYPHQFPVVVRTAIDHFSVRQVSRIGEKNVLLGLKNGKVRVRVFVVIGNAGVRYRGFQRNWWRWKWRR